MKAYSKCDYKRMNKTVTVQAVTITLLCVSLLISVLALAISLWSAVQTERGISPAATANEAVSTEAKQVSAATTNTTELINTLNKQVSDLQASLTQLKREQEHLNSTSTFCGRTFFEFLSDLDVRDSTEQCLSKWREYAECRARACNCEQLVSGNMNTSCQPPNPTNDTNDSGGGNSGIANNQSKLVNNGAVTIVIEDQPIPKYVVSAQWAQEYVHVNDSSVTLRGGGRVYLSDVSTNFTKDSYYQMPLIEKTLTFDVDLSKVGCNCNAALYFVQMPGYNSTQQPVPGEHDEYYCDANAVGGAYCPEMDVLESNKYAMSSTAHTCEYVAPHYYSSCDRGGCGTNILDVNINTFGPGRHINTSKPFTLGVSFYLGANNRLERVTNRFSQGIHSFEFDSCHADYLQWMGYSLPGIVMTMSLWGTGPGGMSWLDGKSGCQGGCNLGESSVTFSNFQLDDL